MNQAAHNKLISFIWSIADDCLRDVYVRGKYRDVILPMVVLRRLDTLLEARLNAAIAPQLRRLVQYAIRQVRGEMAASLQALVAQAIDDALAKRKKP